MQPILRVIVLCAAVLCAPELRADEESESADPAAAPVQLETITVTGTREQGYRATVATTANKTDTAVKEIPFSVQVVTRELIEDRGVTSFGEAVRTVPGLTPQVGFVGTNDRFRLRGFAVPSNLKNGLRRSVFIPIDELANIEQIEVLKGPASALYGRFEPGGVVNLVTKRPMAQQYNALDVTYGDYAFRRATVDSSGPLSESLGYRVNAAWQDSDGFRDFADARTRFLAPVLAWRPSAATELLLEIEYLHREQGLDRGFGNSPLFLQVPINRNYGEAYARGRNISKLGGLTFNHALGEHWSLRIAAHAAQGELNGQYVSYGFPAISEADSADPQVNRSGTLVSDRERDTIAQIELSGRLQALGLTQRLLFGSEIGRQYENASFDWAELGAISLFNPVYGQQFGAVSPNDFEATNDTVALYVQDELSFDPHWRLLLGGRYERIELSAQDSYFSESDKVGVTESAFSPRVGLSYTPLPALSLYASWAQSFTTDVFSRLSGGKLAEPIDGEQFEIGAKFELFDGRFTPTIAWFDITRSNGTVADPNDPTFSFSVQTGEQRSRGVEIDLPVAINRQWRVLASYTRLDAEFTEDPQRKGNRLANAPRDNGSLWSSYDFGGMPGGLSLGLGVHYVGVREANDGNSFQLPGYTRWDSNLAYVFGPDRRYRLQLNAQNLTDRRYYESGGSFLPAYPGAPRSLSASIGVSFR